MINRLDSVILNSVGNDTDILFIMFFIVTSLVVLLIDTVQLLPTTANEEHPKYTLIVLAVYPITPNLLTSTIIL